MEHINNQIAHRVSGELADQKRSQRWLSEATGIPLVTLNRKLRGLRPFDVVELYDITKALDLDMTDLISAADHKAAA